MAKKAASRKTAGAARKSAAARKKGSTGSRKKTSAGRKKAAPGRKKAVASRKRAAAGSRRKPAASRKKATATRKKTAASRKAAPKARRTARKAPARRGGAKKAAPRRGGSGRERTLAQTPKTGRSVTGRTNPFPTKRSTDTPAGAGTTRQAPALDRARRHLRDVEESMGGIPSSLDLDRHASAARTGRAEMREARRDHPEVSPEITGGDVDADWAGAYATGDEAPGGDNMTPDQDRVDDIGKALGVQYEDNEELKGADKIASRDKNRWELDPASSDDYKDRE
ncbi:MAG: DUF6335 family protein [Acidobacteriota bacterium]